MRDANSIPISVGDYVTIVGRVSRVGELGETFPIRVEIVGKNGAIENVHFSPDSLRVSVPA